ncbi:MAG: Lrp/AsnC family transcriptional regulator [Dehalococcoidia bacterium]
MEEILRILENNGRIDATQISELTGLKEEEVRELITKAEKDKIILSYKTQIDWGKIGDGPVLAIIEVKIAPQRDVGFDAIAMRIARFPEVKSMHLVSGDYDLSAQIEGKNIYDISNFVTNTLSTIDAVQGTSTRFVLKRYKEDGTLIGGDDTSEGRLPVSL